MLWLIHSNAVGPIYALPICEGNWREGASHLDGAVPEAPAACSGIALSTYIELGVLSSTCMAMLCHTLAAVCSGDLCLHLTRLEFCSAVLRTSELCAWRSL